MHVWVSVIMLWLSLFLTPHWSVETAMGLRRGGFEEVIVVRVVWTVPDRAARVGHGLGASNGRERRGHQLLLG